MEVDVKFDKLGENKIKSPYKGPNVSFKVPPGGCEVICIRVKSKYFTSKFAEGISFK
jgi:hypothetical protein